MVISSLGCGGAERVCSLMTDYWALHGREVTVITLGSEREDFHKLNPAVLRIALDLLGSGRSRLDSLMRNVTRVARVAEAIVRSRSDVVIRFMDTTSVIVLVATRVTGIARDRIREDRSDAEMDRADLVEMEKRALTESCGHRRPE